MFLSVFDCFLQVFGNWDGMSIPQVFLRSVQSLPCKVSGFQIIAPNTATPMIFQLQWPVRPAFWRKTAFIFGVVAGSIWKIWSPSGSQVAPPHLAWNPWREEADGSKTRPPEGLFFQREIAQISTHKLPKRVRMILECPFSLYNPNVLYGFHAEWPAFHIGNHRVSTVPMWAVWIESLCHSTSGWLMEIPVLDYHNLLVA